MKLSNLESVDDLIAVQLLNQTVPDWVSLSTRRMKNEGWIGPHSHGLKPSF